VHGQPHDDGQAADRDHQQQQAGVGRIGSRRIRIQDPAVQRNDQARGDDPAGDQDQR
jgi:hypothetical protein